MADGKYQVSGPDKIEDGEHVGLEDRGNGLVRPGSELELTALNEILPVENTGKRRSKMRLAIVLVALNVRWIFAASDIGGLRNAMSSS